MTAPLQSQASSPTPRASSIARRARWIPGNYTAAETAAARSVLEHWNKTFAGVIGATRAQLNRADNIRAVVRELRAAQRAADTGPDDDFARLDAAMIRNAITAYAADAGCQKLQRWKSFRDWLDAETIVKFAAVAQARNLAAPRELSPKEKAAKIVTHLNLHVAAEQAIKQNLRLSVYIRNCLASASKDYDAITARLDAVTDPRKISDLLRDVHYARRRLEHWERITALGEERVTLPAGEPRTNALHFRAKAIFADYHGRPFRSYADVPRLNAILLALLDLEPSAAGGPP
jgi:hypothetical protein